MKNKLFIVVIIFLCAACNVCRVAHKFNCCINKQIDTFYIEKIKIIKDSIEVIKPDTAYLEAFLDCDTNKNIIIKEIENKNTQLINLNYTLKNNVLKIKLYNDSIKILHKIIEDYRNNIKIKQIYIYDNTRINQLTKELKKQKIKFISLVSCLLIIIILYILIKLKIIKI